MDEFDYLDERLSAIHEAGHAVLALTFEWRIKQVQLIADDPCNTGRIHLVDGDVPEDSDPVGSIAFLSAGVCAEAIARNRPSCPTSENVWLTGEVDRREAHRIARKLFASIAERRLARRIDEISHYTFQFLATGDAATVLHAIAAALLEAKELDGHEVDAIWRHTRARAENVRAFRAHLECVTA